LPMSIAPPAYVSSDEEDAEITAHNVRSVPYRAPPPGLEPPAGRIKLKGTIVPIYTKEQQERLGVDANGSDKLAPVSGGTGAAAAEPSKAARDGVAEADAAMAAAALSMGMSSQPGKLPSPEELQAALKSKSKEGMAALQAFATMDLSWAHELMAGHEHKSRQELEADAVDARKRASSAKQAEEEYLAAAAARGDLRSGEGFNSQYMVHMRALEAGMDAYGLSDADKAAQRRLDHGDEEELVDTMTKEGMDRNKPNVE